ncbi:TetR/AcrR family transcriptional regulator [Symbioplanes lichenis]|uniref:TetR/AcrR family transcriptional regulator n=1 Tax=Symbioplanes lichenis TaxID=1629072 RepID=UPI00273A27D9|nr:TetR/AcrR family transcriptional regulator [Actinoplanes lichenis]
MTPTDGKPGRRRGQELENALLDAAWDELNDHGYGAFTIDAVAQRAGTSRAVLYRRWPTRDELAQAAITHAVRTVVRTVPDTGSLRGDLIAMLLDFNETRSQFAAMLSVHLGAFYAETGQTIADLRRSIVREESGPTVQEIYDRAAARGELDPDRLTPRIANLPFDLYRHDIMVTLQPLSEAAVVEIVDDIFLPLVRPRPA